MPELSAVKTRIGEKATETPWRTCQIGWYFLRTGKAKEAREYFARAKQLYDARGELSFAAQPLRGLLLAALTDGQLDDALDFAAEIKQRNPAKYADNADSGQGHVAIDQGRRLQGLSGLLRHAVPAGVGTLPYQTGRIRGSSGGFAHVHHQAFAQSRQGRFDLLNTGFMPQR